LFATKCVTCHTIGQGEKIGPDLAEALATRDREWLARYIAAPDRMRSAGDPIANALFEKYSTVRMPNLYLSEAEAPECSPTSNRRQRARPNDSANGKPE
jgi:protein SCO1/2